MKMDFTFILGLIKKLVLLIFEKFDVIKEFEALDIDVAALLEEWFPAGEEAQP